MKTEPFVIERTYNAPLSRVWKAITDKDDMRKWYFDLDDFKPVVGFSFHFSVQDKGKNFTYVHLCKVTEVITEQKITYSWSYKGYEGMSYVTFELFAEGDKTRLKLTHEGLETFPPLKEFAKENFVKGWTEITGRMLRDFVEA